LDPTLKKKITILIPGTAQLCDLKVSTHSKGIGYPIILTVAKKVLKSKIDEAML